MESSCPGKYSANIYYMEVSDLNVSVLEITLLVSKLLFRFSKIAFLSLLTCKSLNTQVIVLLIICKEVNST